MNSWAGVEVPGQHSVMVSFVSVNLQFYRYELCKPQLSARDVVWVYAGVLASLNTPEEWHDVMKLLQNYSEDEVYIGLRSASPGMPTMYRNTFQWSDGTVAYYVHAIGYGDKPYCAYFTEKVYRRKDLEVDSCDRKDAAQHYLNGHEHVTYTFVCDFRPDCSDASDEKFCVFAPCRKAEFPCSNRRRLSKGNNSCPETHFQCPGVTYYCLPVYVRCNDVYDCPGKEDEEECDGYKCPGFYRCRGSSICLHALHICDGVYQCPFRDDEMLCDVICPEGCTCYVMAFVCERRFRVSDFPKLRFLDARGSGMTPGDLWNNTMLVHVGLSLCGISHLDHFYLPNLRSLDLSDNRLTSFNDDHMVMLSKLQELSLAGNPIMQFAASTPGSRQTFPALRRLDISRVIIPELNVDSLDKFPNLHTINLSGSGVERLRGEGFRSLQKLRVVDFRGCPLTQIPQGVFEGLETLDLVFADNYRLCCSEILPASFNKANCHAPVDEISSCEALLRSDFYRVLLSGFATFALLGNFGSFVYRALLDKPAGNQGFVVLVAHLCLSDFLMGVYLALIGVADRVYRGTYLWNDKVWKQSAACKAAGFLSLLSSEVSAFIICLITMDRFLVLRFPFNDVHFGKQSAHVACVVVWAVGILLAAVPLLPVTSYWNFYGQNGICIPLPITRADFPGHSYSFAVIIVLNFVLFVMIATGQVFVYWSIRSNRISSVDTTKKSQDLTIARRLITIAMSDFLCWFPIGVLGLLASSGTPVPSEVNVAVAILLLPINSALNPFLYTINMILERRRLAQERRLTQILMSTFNSKTTETCCVSPNKGNN
nr:hypothetical protein BaRGS_030422 [Batillaria attramentaria]